MKFFIKVFSPGSCYSLSVIFKESDEHHIIKHPVCILPLGQDTEFHAYTE